MYAPHPHPQDGVPAGGSFLASPDHSSRRRAKSKGELYSVVTTYLKLLPLFLVKDRQEMEIRCCPCVHTNIFYVWCFIELIYFKTTPSHYIFSLLILVARVCT